jgi:hypothetical protein
MACHGCGRASGIPGLAGAETMIGEIEGRQNKLSQLK